MNLRQPRLQLTKTPTQNDKQDNKQTRNKKPTIKPKTSNKPKLKIKQPSITGYITTNRTRKATQEQTTHIHIYTDKGISIGRGPIRKPGIGVTLLFSNLSV